MVLVEFERLVLVWCTLVGCYGRMLLYHMRYRCYGKIRWQHRFDGGIDHVLGVEFRCVS